MLRLAREEDIEKLLGILRKDPARAMFIIGDIEQNGLHTEYQTTWLEETEGTFSAVYLKNHSNFVFYLISDDFDPKHISLLLAATRCENINAVKSHYVKVKEYLGSDLIVREMYFCACAKQGDEPDMPLVRQAEAGDAHRIAASLARIVEFNLETLRIGEREERIRFRLSTKKSRAFMYEVDDVVVAYASTAVETGSSAMVASVFCLPEYRGNGYAKQVVQALSADLLKDGLLPCLFYDNPDAGRIYHALGYTTFDTWILAKNEGVQP